MSQNKYTEQVENDNSAVTEKSFEGRNISDNGYYRFPPDGDAGCGYYMERMFGMLLAKGCRRDEVLTRLLYK